VDSFVTLTYAMPMRSIKDKTNVMQTYVKMRSKKLKLHLSSLNPRQAYS
jgi:hypothetical protein